MVAPDVSGWSGVRVERRVEGGHRNEVWSGHDTVGRVSIRRSRRSPASLAWELDLLAKLDRGGFLVPTVMPTDAGEMSADGIVVQRWIDGREPSTSDDWHLVARELGRLHAEFADQQQRPDCRSIIELDRVSRSVDADMAAVPDDAAAAMLAVFAEMSAVPVSLIHGDPGPSNIRITDDGRVGLLDWDESRVDVTHLDLADLDVQVLDRAAHARARRGADAWEAANAWVAEPEYARQRLDRLDG